MLWISKERAACYANEHITIRSTADKSVLFTGTIRGLKFTFSFSSENVKENNSVECSLPGLAECTFYPFHILGSAATECSDRYDRVCEAQPTGFSLENFSQHTFSFEKTSGEVLFTAKLLKHMPVDWVETPTGGRRRHPPYALRFNEKTRGIGYSENIYLDPIKQLIAAGMKNSNDAQLTCDLRDWCYAIEEHIAAGKLSYPDGRMLAVKNEGEEIYPQANKIFRPGCTVKDYVEIGGKRYWYVADYSKDSNDSQANATIIFESDYAENALLRFEGSFIRQSVPRAEKVVGRVRGHVAYYRISGIVSTVGKDGGEVSEKIDLYNDEKAVEQIAVSSLKHEVFKLLYESHLFTANQSIAAPEKVTGLDDLIGLHSVKQTFEEFRRFGEYKRNLSLASGKGDNGGDKLLDIFKREPRAEAACGRNRDEISLHMVFLGSPGTGKTSVAERIADMLKEYGLVVSNPVPIVCVKSDLVGQHIGETEAIVRKKIDEAMGGILFIDEAYTLYESDNDRDYGQIALNEIMYAMETHRDRLVVIMAGYENEMLHMIREANTGLSSRLNWIFHFDDFSPEEMWEILQSKVEKNGYTLDSSTAGLIQCKATGYFALLQKELDGVKVDGKQRHYFGNGRGVRTFFQFMQIGLAVRLSNNNNIGDLRTFTPGEVDFAYNKFINSSGKLKEEQTSRIGFSQS